MRGIWLFLLIAILASPALAVAQTGTTEPVGTVSTGDDEVFRAYDNPDVYFDALSGVLAFGSVYDSDDAASRSLGSTAEIFVASLRGGLSTDESGEGDYDFGELEDVEIAPVGDESRASRLPLVLFGSFDGEYGIVVVRQGSWVQVLVGFGFGEVDVVPELEAIATTIQPRWPSDEPVAVREDGLRTGGIWNLVPRPEDLPEGFEVDPEFEEGPAATVDTIVPVGTREPRSGAATPVAPVDPDAGESTPEAASPSNRRIPLIPTEAPPEATAEQVEPDIRIAPTGEEEATETPAAVTAAPATEEAAQPVATPQMNERLARPFDATVEIIIAGGSYERNEDDGSCAGGGLLDSLAADGELVLREGNGDTLATATIANSGVVTYDTVLKQDVCYLTARFTDVPARAEYVLVAGESVIGRFGYAELASGEPALVVIGAE